ncbi:MAG TPA: DUF2799 domain-containing protein [Pseudomonadales bacterium]
MEMMIENCWRNTRWASLLLFLMIISGCATLNEEECQLADWETIGYEDGRVGSNQIGRHRSACAKHGITPDFEAYKAGHEQGLRIFCQPDNGFRIGTSGKSYGGICPADLESEFIHAYKVGKEIYLAKRLVERMSDDLANKKRALQHLGESLAAKEVQLISKQGNFTERAQLLLEIKEAHAEQGALEADIIRLEQDIAVADRELMVLSTKHGF